MAGVDAPSPRGSEPPPETAVPDVQRDNTLSEAAQWRPGDPGDAAYPLSEAEYWRQTHVHEPYHEVGRSFQDYSTAYELGWVCYHHYGGEFDTAERVLTNEWLVRKGVSTLTWERARPAVRAAWQRADNMRSFVTDGTAGPQDVKDALAVLCASARDGELAFREAAGQTGTAALRALFERLADQWVASGAELQAQLQQLGQTGGEGGTIAGAAQRAWLQIRGLFGAPSDRTILEQCGRGEDALLQQYREALRRNLPRAVHSVLQRHFEQAQRQRDHIKWLRDDGAAAAPADTGQPAEAASQ